MLVNLLATDPATPADVLTFLAAHPALTAADFLALAAHPALPPAAPLTIPRLTDTALHTALAHPGVPPGRRKALIAAHGSDSLLWNIAHYDDLTPHEIADVYARTTNPDLGTFAVNTRTPPAVAAVVAAALYRTGGYFDTKRADVLTLRNHLTPTTPATRNAASAPDPLAAYAQHLLDTAAPRAADDIAFAWWPKMLDAFPHPLLTAAALDLDPRAAARPSMIVSVICSALAPNTRATPEHRYLAARLSPRTLPAVAATAPDHHLRAILARAPRTGGWGNVHATDTTLRAMLHHAATHTGAPNAPAAIALHPSSTAGLRTDALTANTLPAPWLTTLVTHLNAWGTVLDAPLPDLLDAEEVADHVGHWARDAWARANHPAPASLPYVQALLALEAARFPGSLRELLHTARTVAAGPPCRQGALAH